MKPSSKKCFLLKQSPENQCKCIIHENFINKLKALSTLYHFSLFWDTVLCNNTTNSQYWQRNCEDCGDGKKVIVNIDPGKMFFAKNGKSNSKFQVMTQSKCVGELLESLVSE